jgi:hypothetical protein
MTFDLNIVIYLLSLAFTAGVTWAKISILEKKVEKHNNFMERLVKAEDKIIVQSDDIKIIKEKLKVV